MQESALRPPLARGPGWHIGDPPILLDLILDSVEDNQKQQIIGLQLEAVAATLEINLKYIRGVQSLLAGGNQ